MVEVWTHGVASPRGIKRIATDLEDNGWDGLCVVDSQNLSGDAYVSLAIAATVTKQIGLGTAVTNSVTRMAAATAAGIASVDRVSGGRAILGIGRGDSALAHLGLAPARLKQFETYVSHLQTYLRGDAVPFDEIESAVCGYVYGDSTAGQAAMARVGLTGIPVINVNNNW